MTQAATTVQGQVTNLQMLTGRKVRSLMQSHHVTIRQLAQRMNITLKRVREVREKGVTGNCFCRDWYEAITGTGDFSPS